VVWRAEKGWRYVTFEQTRLFELTANISAPAARTVTLAVSRPIVERGLDRRAVVTCCGGGFG